MCEINAYSDRNKYKYFKDKLNFKPLLNVLNSCSHALLRHNTRRTLASIFSRRIYKRMQEMRNYNASEDEYSFKPFDQHRCIFVHIPKAGGISVSKSLFGNLSGGHISIEKYQIIFSKEDFDRYFKFSFVRNPWSRLFSAYNFLRKGGINAEDKKWAAENLATYKDFNDFVIRGLRKRSTIQHIHFVPQSNLLCAPYGGELVIDFVGFFENFKDDFDIVKRELLFDPNLSLRHDNVTKASSACRPNYKISYSDEAREIVSEVYRRDIELFRYNFDNSSLESQLAQRVATTDK